MRYLKLHKLLWFLIVVAYTLVDCICIFVYLALYFIWNFKFKKCSWKSFHKADRLLDANFYGFAYEDNNIWETIIRRYKAMGIVF